MEHDRRKRDGCRWFPRWLLPLGLLAAGPAAADSLPPLTQAPAHSALYSGPQAKGQLRPAGRRPTWAAVRVASWDLDDSGEVDLGEWRQGLRRMRVFDRWDMNGDGVIEAVELSLSLLAELDLDGDQAVSPAEQRVGARGWLGQTDRFGTFSELDLDDDQRLDHAELARGIVEGGLLASWDRDEDRMLNENELADALFRTWDRYRDGGLGAFEGPDDPARALPLAGVRAEP